MDDSDLNESEEDFGDELMETEDSEDEADLTESKKELFNKVESYKKAALQFKRELKESQKMLKKTKEQLDEANLFNVKLVCANKLLHNESLSEKQRVSIINALEAADSVKEVKKVYAMMNETLKSGKSGLTENSKRVLGGASKVQKSGAATTESLNESEKQEFNRWGQLAGILND